MTAPFGTIDSADAMRNVVPEPQAPKHTALLPVRVNALPWEDRGETITDRFRADTVVGVYYIGRGRGGLFEWRSSATRGKYEVRSFEEAKAAAQAHYKRLILSAIEPDPSSSAQEVRAALEPFRDGNHPLKNTHLMSWLEQGYMHCKNGSEDWCQSYLDSAMGYIFALEDAVRAALATTPETAKPDTSAADGLREADFLQQLRQANITRNAEYRAKTNGEALPLLFRTTEFAGEVGELLNVVKKIERERLGWGGKRATREMLLEEFGGVLATLDLLAMELDVDLAAATLAEFNAVTDRLSLATKLPTALHPAPATASSGGMVQPVAWRWRERASGKVAEWKLEPIAPDQSDLRWNEVEALYPASTIEALSKQVADLTEALAKMTKARDHWIANYDKQREAWGDATIRADEAEEKVADLTKKRDEANADHLEMTVEEYAEFRAALATSRAARAARGEQP